MSVTGIPVFSESALSVLDRQRYDPAARAGFEFMSGGLIWPDEFPRPGTSDWAAVSPNWVYRYLIAYRASLTLRVEQPAFLPVWEQVIRYAPHWPGLRPERRDEESRRRLLAAKRRGVRCLDQLEAEIKKDDG